MSEASLFQLPPRLEIIGDETLNGIAIEISTEAISIAGFADFTFRQRNKGKLVWPRPLLQIEGSPLIKPHKHIKFFGHKYNTETRAISNKVVEADDDFMLKAAFDVTGKGMVVSGHIAAQ